MRVDFVTKEYPPNIYGGAGVHVSELVKNLRRTTEVHVHAFGKPIDEKDTLGYEPLGDLQNQNQAIQTLGTDLAIVQNIAGSDLVHSHTWYANFAGHLSSLLHGIPHVITAHSLEPLRPWKKEQLGGGYAVSSFVEKAAYLQASRIIAVSSGMREDILRSYPEVDPAKVEVVYNGIDSERWKPTTDDSVLASHGVDRDRRSIIFVGRITRQKGLTYFLQAAKSLPEDVQIILCAGAPDTEELMGEIENLVTELSSTRSGVIWIPEHLDQRSLAVLLSHADLFACPSIYEPLGIVNLEAMACGTAVIGTRTGGIPEVVLDSETGWLVPIEQVTDGSGTPIDPEKFIASWSQAMLRAFSSGDLDAFGKAGRERAIQSFSWKSIATRTLEVYQSALDS
ncbi:glycogen synthase [Aquiluna sp.]|nr:glycogen synthase [Aquiluna sp.]